jgi:hypothetical protein
MSGRTSRGTEGVVDAAGGAGAAGVEDGGGAGAGACAVVTLGISNATIVRKAIER